MCPVSVFKGILYYVILYLIHLLTSTVYITLVCCVQDTSVTGFRALQDKSKLTLKYHSILIAYPLLNPTCHYVICEIQDPARLIITKVFEIV